MSVTLRLYSDSPAAARRRSIRYLGQVTVHFMPRTVEIWVFTKYTSVNMAVRHKHLKLDQDKIDRARRLFGVKTEQETIERALDLALAEEPLLRVHRRVRGVGAIADVFGKS